MTDAVVLVALDGSNSAQRALPIAQRLADLEKAAVRIVHVTEGAGAPGDAEAILAAAAGATLIVMCAHTAHARPAGEIGAAALAVLRGAQCPVVLVDPTRAPDGWALRRVLAPHDGSPAVSSALGPATGLARAAGAELIVLQVAHETRALEPGSIAPLMYPDQVQHSWPAWSEEFLQRLGSCCSLAEVQVRLLVAHGAPAREAIRVAEEERADLMALVWKGRWEAPHARVLRAVLQGAPCPVMVTRVAG